VRAQSWKPWSTGWLGDYSAGQERRTWHQDIQQMGTVVQQRLDD
jgi:hypothetical protein